MAITNSALIVPPAKPVSGVETNDILPIRPPVEIPSGWEWLWWILGALAVAALVAWGVRYWRRKMAERARFVEPPEPPYIRARRKLEAALQLLSDPKAFCVAVSDTLRVYLEERFNLRAPESTTEEFLHDLQRTTLLNQRQKDILTEFLQQCDLVKFARYEPTEQALRELRETALRIVDETAFDTLAPTESPKPAPTQEVA